MNSIHLRSCLSDDWVKAQVGKLLDDSHYNQVISREAVDVYKPNGKVLLKLRPNTIPQDLCDQAWPALKIAGNKWDDHRGLNTGSIGMNAKKKNDEIVCRKTAYTYQDIQRWGLVLPFIWKCNDVFRRHYPQRYIIQRRQALLTHPHILRTAFTTGAVNYWDEQHSAQTPVHVDQQDLREGFGVMSMLRHGNYDGGLLVFPQYQIAVDLHTTDVLLADVHEYHGNTAIYGDPDWHRIAVILYYKELMQYCKK